MVASLGEWDAGLRASREVSFVRVGFCPSSSLPLGVEGLLRFVIVAIPGLFYYFFSIFSCCAVE